MFEKSGKRKTSGRIVGIPGDAESFRRRRKKRRQMQVRCAVLAACCCMAAFSVFQLSKFAVRSIQTRRENKALQEMYYAAEDAQDTATEAAEETVEEPISGADEEESGENSQALNTEKTEDVSESQGAQETQSMSAGQMAAALVSSPIQEKFRALYRENNDLVGWLNISDVLDLPVVQRDNEYYLTHDFSMRRSNEGTVFLEDTASVRPKSSMLCLYGHNMKDGTMFAPLTNYASVTYYKNHPTVNFDTLYESGYYVIFSAFTFSTDAQDKDYFPLRHAGNFQSAEELARYAKELKARSNYWVPIDVNGEDEYLAMITCTYTHDNARFGVFARRIRDGESVTALRQAAKEAY